jgi:putative restriction endonuclease
MATFDLQNYIHAFSHMRTDSTFKGWTSVTNGRAPHKPFLLLSIIDLITQGSLRINLIQITPELGSLFAGYWSAIMPQHSGNMALPFFHLKSSKFWHLLPVPGKESTLESVHQVDTLSQLQKLILGAKLDDDLFQLLQVNEARDILRATIIQTYFTVEVQPVLTAQGAINWHSYQYSQKLIEQVKKQIREITSAEEQYQDVVRDQGFRRAVVQVYDHRCAFCGVRMLTADGHTAVEAAHIVPWSVSFNDDPRNGIALCRLCHWTFDEGLTGVSSKYSLLLSDELRTSLNIPGHLLSLDDRPIIGPKESSFMPDLQSLSWHRQKVFRASRKLI